MSTPHRYDDEFRKAFAIIDTCFIFQEKSENVATKLHAAKLWVRESFDGLADPDFRNDIHMSLLQLLIRKFVNS